MKGPFYLLQCAWHHAYFERASRWRRSLGCAEAGGYSSSSGARASSTAPVPAHCPARERVPARGQRGPRIDSPRSFPQGRHSLFRGRGLWCFSILSLDLTAASLEMLGKATASLRSPRAIAKPLALVGGVSSAGGCGSWRNAHTERYLSVLIGI